MPVVHRMAGFPRARCSLVMLLACAVPLAAQAPAQREQIEALRDSLAVTKDSAGLLATEKRLIMRASHEWRDSAMVHLRLGFIALRLGDLSGRKHYEDAASEFQWAADLQPRWPYGWFGLGLAELGVGDAEFALLRGLQSALGKDALTRSANDFARSADVDPGFVRGLVELTNTALRQRINLRMDVALAALRHSARTAAARNPEVLLARARIEREVGSADSALAAVDSLLNHDPSSAAGLLEQARVLFRLGRPEGGESWYRGLTIADSATVALYRADLLFVLPDSTLHAFDAATGQARATLMRRFWDYRDRDELRVPGERLMEHYRRLEYARHNYRLASIHRHYDIVERYRPPVAEFDDRGVVYIRQGTPDDRASLELPGLAYNESWVYHRANHPDLLFHFVAREGVTDFRLVESAFDILGFATAVRLQSTGDVQGADALLIPPRNRGARIGSDSVSALRQRTSDANLSRVAEAILRSREPLNPIYRRLLASGKGSAPGLEAEERSLGSRSIRIGTSTDNWSRTYAAALPAEVQALAMAGDSASPIVEIAYAIPTNALRTAADSAVAPRLRAAVLGLDGQIAAVVDTIVGRASALSSGPSDHLFGLVPVRVPAGRFVLRVGLEGGSAGVVSDRDTIDVPSPAALSLALSDLVLGTRSVPLSWVTATGDTAWVNPLMQFHADEPMQLYFDVTGAPRDSSYRLELVVRRTSAKSLWQRITGIFGSGGAVHITFSRRATGSRDQIHREVALEKLKPGAYTLEITASAGSGQTASRHQDFAVIR